MRSRFLLALFPFALPALADEPVPPDHAAKMAASAALFKEKVRPFLEKNCLECHGAGKAKGGFSLGSRESLLKGGDRGPAVIPGEGRQSPPVRAAARGDGPHMPPKKSMPKEAVELLAKWIDLGAAYDRPLIEGAAAGKKPMTVTDKDRQYWAYRPLQKVTVPPVKDAGWVRNPID